MAQAVVIPFLTTVGGGSVATGAILTGAAVATVGSGVISAQQSRAAGRMQQAQAEINANAEGDAARERETQRKKLLLRAISSQVAEAGASGIRFSEGSPEQIARLDIDESRRDIEFDRANTLQRQRGLRSQGRAARIAGNARAASTLLDTAAKATDILV